MRIPKPYQHWARLAKAQGWGDITVTGSGHLAWHTPEGQAVFTPATPGDNYGGLIRVRSKLRRAGLKGT